MQSRQRRADVVARAEMVERRVRDHGVERRVGERQPPDVGRDDVEAGIACLRAARSTDGAMSIAAIRRARVREQRDEADAHRLVEEVGLQHARLYRRRSQRATSAALIASLCGATAGRRSRRPAAARPRPSHGVRSPGSERWWGRAMRIPGGVRAGRPLLPVIARRGQGAQRVDPRGTFAGRRCLAYRFVPGTAGRKGNGNRHGTLDRTHRRRRRHASPPGAPTLRASRAAAWSSRRRSSASTAISAACATATRRTATSRSRRRCSIASRRSVELGYTPEDIEKGRALKGKATLEHALADVEAARKAVASAGKVGIVGYCWGGYVTWMSGARLPGFACAVPYYGGGMLEAVGEKPRCPVLAHFGEKDHDDPGRRRAQVRRGASRGRGRTSTRRTTASTATSAARTTRRPRSSRASARSRSCAEHVG